VLALFAFGATLAGIAQGKGWDYHFIAAKAGILLLLVTTLASLLDRLPGRLSERARLEHLRHGIAGAGLILLFFLSGALAPPFKAQLAFPTSPAGRMLAIVRAHAEGRPVMWLTTSIYPQFPVLPMANSTLALHFLSLWLLPPLYADAPALGDRVVFRAPDAMPVAEAYLFRSVGVDLAQMQPALIVVTRPENEAGFGGLKFDYIDYFKREPAFAHAFQNYRHLTDVGGWTIYERNPG
jgi:hypothetical protein